MSHTFTIVAAVAALLLVGCGTVPRPGTLSERRGDEIMVAGKLFHTGTPVVLWFDKGGYDAYRVEARFKPFAESGWEAFIKHNPDFGTPNRYGFRVDRFNNGRANFTDEEIEAIRDGWTLGQLQGVVDQFVLHYDVCGTSERCFKVLHDLRCLSVHFMLDVDGTVYQTLDLKERAWHAGTANSRSVGVEIANMGAYGPNEENPFARWYAQDERGTYVTIPAEAGGPESQRVPGRYYTARPDPVTGVINGREVTQYDLTDAQYAALIKLTAALVEVFPQMRNDYPRDASGHVDPNELSDDDFAAFKGIIGHWHETDNKIDPGPALDWERVRKGVEREQSRRW